MSQDSWLPQLQSPGLTFRLGIIICQGLDTLFCHISQHREGGLHNEVNETCRKCSINKDVSLGELGRGEREHDCEPQLQVTKPREMT